MGANLPLRCAAGTPAAKGGFRRRTPIIGSGGGDRQGRPAAARPRASPAHHGLRAARAGQAQLSPCPLDAGAEGSLRGAGARGTRRRRDGERGDVSAAPWFPGGAGLPASIGDGGRGDVRRLRRAGLQREWRSVAGRSEEHTSELPSLMRISYAVFCLNKKTKQQLT